MWPLLLEYVHESIVVSLDDAARAMRLTAERARVIAEGAGACAVAAAVSPQLAARGHRHVVAVVSGGNIDLSRFAQLVGAASS
jgi:threonine dehydratase